MIDDALFENINQRSDVVLSSCSAAGVPSLIWAMCGRLLADRRTVLAWVREDQSRQFLADVRATGRVAAVFNEPYTNIAVQFKGAGAAVRPGLPEDEPTLREHVGNMVRAIERVGFGAAFTRAMFEQPWSALAVVSVVATQVFVQTPGPHAGRPLEPAAGKPPPGGQEPRGAA